MKKIFTFAAFLLLSGLALACGSDVQRVSMAKRLYEDTDMRKFVCGSDSCSMQDFEERVQFHRYDESFRGKILSVCLVEPVLSATNSYTGVFAKIWDGFEFQFISYGTGVKVGIDKMSVPMILEYGISDPDNIDYSVNQYLWNGRFFVFVKNVPLHN
ncbi:hypothetical protein [Burkholderia ubonensis]|uniref:hypothetical protein n=1 Tax=Burkholderia ubonensis TaxID=101571 RepID=UPI0012F8884A|nr:hypothetical protein [Burkholderia ubonensis]